VRLRLTLKFVTMLLYNEELMRVKNGDWREKRSAHG